MRSLPFTFALLALTASGGLSQHSRQLNDLNWMEVADTNQSSGLSGTALRQHRRRTDQAVPLVNGFGIPEECPDAPTAFGETPTI